MIKRLLRITATKLPGVSRVVQERDKLRESILQDKKRFAYEHGHFYSAIPSPEDIDQRYRELDDQDLNSIAGIDLNTAEQLQWCNQIARYYEDLPFEETPSDGVRYHYDNQTFVYADAVFLFGMLRQIKPKRIVEVGSGYSSALMLDTNERFLNGEVKLTFIEPFPDRLYGLIGTADRKQCKVIEKKIQEVDAAVWGELEAGDIFFIDSSHVSKCGSDVNRIYFDILPTLAPGVIVHVHDVFPHFEYPQNWPNQGRYWNENYLLRAFLQFNSEFEILLWGPQMIATQPEFFRTSMPICLRNSGGSIWMRRVESRDAT